MEPIEFLGDFVDGRFLMAEKSDGEITDISPADLNDVVMRLHYKYDHVMEACRSIPVTAPTAMLDPVGE